MLCFFFLKAQLFANYLTENCIPAPPPPHPQLIVLCFGKNQAKQMGSEAQSEIELIKAILGKGQGNTADLQACKVNICQQFTSSYEMEVKHQHLSRP